MTLRGSVAAFILAIATTNPSQLSFTANGTGATRRSVASKLGDVVSVKDYGAVLDGQTDDYGSVANAMAALPSAGGSIVIPDSASGMKIASPIVVTKPITFYIGKVIITGPATGYLFDIQANGSAIMGAGGTESGALGAGLGTVLKASAGAAGVIINREAMGTTYKNFAIDMNLAASATGFYHYGGWYVTLQDVDVMYDRVATTSIGLKVFSHTLAGGVPGPTGSYGGVFVSNYINVRTSSVRIDSDGVTQVTTLTFVNLDAKYLYVARALTITFLQPILQGLAGQTVLVDIVDTSAISFISGDFERGGLVGPQTIFNLTGTVRGLRSSNNLLANFGSGYTDTYVAGTISDGCSFDDYTQFWTTVAAGPKPARPLRTGTAGTAAQHFRNNGWNIESGIGLDYSGDTLNVGMNCVAASATTCNLSDVSQNGWINEWNTNFWRAGFAVAGANPRTYTKTFEQDSVGNTTVSGRVTPGSTTFGGLGTPANGSIIYCSDCTIANPCAAAGTGAIAKRINNAWICN